MSKHIKLSDIKKEQPFKVPENYFNNFDKRLYDKIGIVDEQKKYTIYKILNYFKSVTAVTVTAVTAMVITVMVVAMLYNQPEPDNNFNYVENYFGLYFDDYILYSYLEDESEVQNEYQVKDEDILYLISDMSDYELYQEIFK